MRRRKHKSTQSGEEGVVILLVAIVLLFIVTAIAALAIDLVTFYTARSEAQLAADGAALAGARVLANSGMTSNPADGGLASGAENLAFTVAVQVARHNRVGGKILVGAAQGLNCGQEICVSVNDADGTNPRVTVQVTRADLPTFFARIWGTTIVTVRATAKAEAYNPSPSKTDPPDSKRPVAPICVKPWVLPNMASAGAKIFDENTGAIQDVSLLGQSVDGGPGGLSVTCSGNCGGPPVTAQAWKYFPGNQTSFPAPVALPACSLGFNDYQKSIVGCVQQPVSCQKNSGVVDLDTTSIATNPDAQLAVTCVTHAQNNFGDSIDASWFPGAPFQYVGGNDNPIAGAQAAHVMVSDSLVTVPVVDVSPGTNFPANPVQVIGFVQFFLNPTGTATPGDHVPAKIINLVGCGKNATRQPVLGHGSSPVAVRLVANP